MGSGRNRTLLLSRILLVLVASHPAFAVAALRQTVSLNADWRFARQDNPGSGVEWPFRDASKPGYDDSGWSRVIVPHTWDKSAHNPWVALNHWRGIGWYRREFDVPETAGNRKVFLEFEGAFQVTTVWVNGSQLAKHVGGYTGFMVDITGVARVGEKNLLALSVDSTNSPDIPPANETNVSVYGGLYRDVWLHIMGPTYIPDGGVTIRTPQVNGQQSTVNVLTEITNAEPTSGKLRLESAILAKSGEVVAEDQATKEAGSGQTVEFAQPGLVVKQPALWDPDHPNLYTLRSRVYRDGRIVDEFSTRFGIRLMGYVPGKGYTINGKFINIHGVNRRQDYGYLGDAAPDAISRRDMEIIKGLGANSYRALRSGQERS